MDFCIRKARVTDAEEINKVMKQAFADYEKETCHSAAKGALSETVEQTTEDIKNKIFLVAEANNCILGSVRVSMDCKDAYLSRFSVLSEYRQFGIGKSLITEIDRILTDSGINSISLHTALDVKHLIHFYESNGFVVESITEDMGYKRAMLRKIYR